VDISVAFPKQWPELVKFAPCSGHSRPDLRRHASRQCEDCTQYLEPNRGSNHWNRLLINTYASQACILSICLDQTFVQVEVQAASGQCGVHIRYHNGQRLPRSRQQCCIVGEHDMRELVKFSANVHAKTFGFPFGPKFCEYQSGNIVEQDGRQRVTLSHSSLN
jgi:hypothetical protein